MFHWPGNNWEIMSHNNFKLGFSERSLNLFRDFYFHFCAIWEVWLPWVLIWLKIDHGKRNYVGLGGQCQKMTSHNNFKLSLSKRSLGLVKGFLFKFGVIWEIWLAGVIIQVKNCHSEPRNVKLTEQRRRNDVKQQFETKCF